MTTFCLETSLDWLIYADYLDDQGINHFIREDLQCEEVPWTYEYFDCFEIGGGIPTSRGFCSNSVGDSSCLRAGTISPIGSIVGTIYNDAGVRGVGAMNTSCLEGQNINHFIREDL
jgi:hypothetical protein